MKKILFLSTALLLAVNFLFTSCEKDDPSLVGVWETKEITITPKLVGINQSLAAQFGTFLQPQTITAEDLEPSTIEFTADGKYITTDSGKIEIGTYQKIDNKLTTITDQETVTLDIIKLEKSTLQVSFTIMEMTIGESLDYAYGTKAITEEQYQSMKIFAGNIPGNVLLESKVTFHRK